MPYTCDRPARVPGGRRAGVRVEGGAEAAEGDAGHDPARRRRRRGPCGATRRAPPATVIAKLFADGSVNLNMRRGRPRHRHQDGDGHGRVRGAGRAARPHPDRARGHRRRRQFAVRAGGSKTVPVNAPAVREAALALKRQVAATGAAELEAPGSGPVAGGRRVVERAATRQEGRRSPARAGCSSSRSSSASARAHPHPDGKDRCPFAAQFAEVEVNTRTGEVRVVRLRRRAHDSGRVMNRLTYENQVFGGVTMGIGFALTESG